MRYRFNDVERGDRIDLSATKRALAEQNRSRIIKARAALAGHQPQRNFRRRAKHPRAERASVSRQRNQALRLFAFIRARTFRQQRGDSLAAATAVDAIPTSHDKEWQRVKRLLEDAVAVRALFNARRN